ncbi:hypothetical protein QQG55_55805 [Brugia pahangi]
MYDSQTVNTIHGCVLLRPLTQFMDVCYPDRYRNSWMYNAESVNYNSCMYDSQTVNTIHGCMILRPLTQFMDVCCSDRYRNPWIYNADSVNHNS